MSNGYIPANLVNRVNAAGRCAGVCGIPSTYKPYGTPLWPTPADGGSPSAPMYPYYETNTVWVPLKNGTMQRTTLGGYVDPLQQQFVLGPMPWNMGASAFKTVKLTERALLRINADFLNNVFNMPGTTLPSGSTGIATTQGSANSPRVLQLTMRLTF